ncbi:MAG TPA: NADH:flavin oxidoreductase [Vicinamibacteria bacterium]|nr:NADH:flavin oxidoreductase [Vicinamibacteria bacterium]
MSDPGWVRIATLRTAEAFRRHLEAGGIALDFDDTLASPAASPFARPLEADGLRAGNRFCILPMEGWDGTPAGEPTELTERRWRHFGCSGAKLIWGGEAVAVRHDGRANPHQLVIGDASVPALTRLREALVAAHDERHGRGASNDLVIGLQLTHSGRYSRPNGWDRPEPLGAWHHPVLDRRFPAGVRILSDEELDRLTADFVRAAVLAQKAGFAFVDVKHCHGYLGHELLSARDRAGRYGGSFENRTRFLRTIVEGIRAEVPGLRIGVRFSIFDAVPYRKDAHGRGVPESDPARYEHGFGVVHDGDLETALADARELLRLLETLGVRWVCTSAGSPYYTPHLQRPALFPPSDGYLPPEDPLVGVARQIEATARLKAGFPGIVFVGSAYSYLQEWLPNVAERVLREGRADFVGLGRMVLSYPELPADVLAGRPLDRKRICRTFSDCTTAPREGLPSGCYPLDSFYAKRPEAAQLKEIKQALRA